MTKLNYNWTSATTTTSTYNSALPERPHRFFSPKIWDIGSHASLNDTDITDVYELTNDITKAEYHDANGNVVSSDTPPYLSGILGSGSAE